MRADSLGDLKAALGGLRGAAPIRATVELQHTEIDKSKKPPETITGNASVDAVVDADGLHIGYAPALLARVAKEQADREGNPNAHAPTSDAVATLGPLPIAERLDFGRRMLGVLGKVTLSSEKRVVLDGHSVRLLALTIKNEKPKTSIGHAEILEDSFNVWIGDDNIPVAAVRTERFSAGLLFLKFDGTQVTKWALARRDDRLVAVRTEERQMSNGVGQNREETDIITVVVR